MWGFREILFYLTEFWACRLWQERHTLGSLLLCTCATRVAIMGVCCAGSSLVRSCSGFLCRDLNFIPIFRSSELWFISSECYVLLTIHLGSVLVNNQLDSQFFSRIYLFQFSTCFEHPCAHHQENKLYEPLKANFFPLRSTRFNIKKFYIVLALRWGFFYGSQKRQRLLLYISLTDWVFFNRGGKCLQRGTDRFLT